MISITIQADPASLPELLNLLGPLVKLAAATPGGQARRRRPVLSKDDYKALADAGENGLLTADLCQAIGLEPARLPPWVNGWNRRARKAGLNLDDLIRRYRVTLPTGRSATRYILTEIGREKLNPA